MPSTTLVQEVIAGSSLDVAKAFVGGIGNVIPFE